MIKIFTDGASKGNPGPGGYGVIMEFGEHRKEIAEGFRLTTNNRMELMAVIAGLEALTTDKFDIKIYSDSKYVVDAINLKWLEKWKNNQFQKIKNPDLWKRLYPLLSKFKIEFIWVKGHNGHPQNEKCDKLAVDAATKQNLNIDQNYENSSP